MTPNEPVHSAADRIADGAADFVRGVATDVHATFMNAMFGNGQAVPPPYVTNQTSAAQLEGISDMISGSLDAIREQLAGGQDPSHAQEQEHGHGY